MTPLDPHPGNNGHGLVDRPAWREVKVQCFLACPDGLWKYFTDKTELSQTARAEPFSEKTERIELCVATRASGLSSTQPASPCSCADALDDKTSTRSLIKGSRCDGKHDSYCLPFLSTLPTSLVLPSPLLPSLPHFLPPSVLLSISFPAPVFIRTNRVSRSASEWRTRTPEESSVFPRYFFLGRREIEL